MEKTYLYTQRVMTKNGLKTYLRKSTQYLTGNPVGRRPIQEDSRIVDQVKQLQNEGRNINQIMQSVGLSRFRIKKKN